MRATQVLRDEHRVILAALAGMETGVKSLAATLEDDPAWLDKVVDFCRGFTDRFHHAKEEEYLYPKVSGSGVPAAGGPVRVMLQEHEQGRRHLRTAEAVALAAGEGDAEALAAAKQSLSSYVRLLRYHIGKENGVLFVIADQVLTPEDQAGLEQAFERVEWDEMGRGVLEKYRALAQELARG